MNSETKPKKAMIKPPVFRFAPSPNGYLHLGHVYSALVTCHMAKKINGRFLLRLEDIDIGRTRQEFIEAIYEDLKWMGLSWEEPVRRQSEHFSEYEEKINILLENDLIYPCFATRKEISEAIVVKNTPAYPLDPDGAPIYPQIYKNMSASELESRKKTGQLYAYRLDMDAALAFVKEKSLSLTIKIMDEHGTIKLKQASPERWGDTVLVRKDTPTSYHLSVVCDDAKQGVTHITRGKDLEAATDLHALLQAIFELPSPIYHHHPLLIDKTGQKLSKSKGSKSIREMREEGCSPQQIIDQISECTDLKHIPAGI